MIWLDHFLGWLYTIHQLGHLCQTFTKLSNAQTAENQCGQTNSDDTNGASFARNTMLEVHNVHSCIVIITPLLLTFADTFVNIIHRFKQNHWSKFTKLQNEDNLQKTLWMEMLKPGWNSRPSSLPSR